MTLTWLVETVAEMNSSSYSAFLFLSILTNFISRQWNRVTNESMETRAKSRDSCFKPRGTFKNIHATLNVWIPQLKYATSECTLADWSVTELGFCDQVQQPSGGFRQRKSHFTSNEAELLHKPLKLIRYQELHGGALHLHPQWKGQDFYLS